MWMEKLIDSFEKYRQFKNQKINPEDNNVTQVLWDFGNYIFQHRSWSGKTKVAGEQKQEKLENQINLEECLHFFSEKVKMWLRDEAPSITHKDGKRIPEYKPFDHCERDEWYQVVLQIFDKWKR